MTDSSKKRVQANSWSEHVDHSCPDCFYRVWSLFLSLSV